MRNDNTNQRTDISTMQLIHTLCNFMRISTQSGGSSSHHTIRLRFRSDLTNLNPVHPHHSHESLEATSGSPSQPTVILLLLCIHSFLLPCMECRRCLAMRILSVCPSVCLSVKRVYCDETEERSVQIFIQYERSFSLVFWEEEWLVGATPSTLNFGSTGPR